MKKRERSYVLKKDIVIPAGTVFECVDGGTRRFVSGNYEATIGLTKDSCGGLVYGIDMHDKALKKWFKEADK